MLVKVFQRQGSSLAEYTSALVRGRSVGGRYGCLLLGHIAKPQPLPVRRR